MLGAGSIPMLRCTRSPIHREVGPLLWGTGDAGTRRGKAGEMHPGQCDFLTHGIALPPPSYFWVQSRVLSGDTEEGGAPGCAPSLLFGGGRDGNGDVTVPGDVCDRSGAAGRQWGGRMLELRKRQEAN